MTRHAAATSVLAGCFLFGTAAPTRAVDPDPAKLAPTAEQAERAKQLAAKLGDPVFQVRDEATRELRKLGRFALPVLNDTLISTPDPEVRDRCETLLPPIAEADLKVRLEAFLSDTDAKYDHKIPGWDDFSKAAGKSVDARKLFAEACQIKVNVELLQGVNLPKEQYEKLVLARRFQLYQNSIRYVPNAVRTPAKLSDVATLLFAESAGAIANRNYYYTVTNLLTQNRDALAADSGEPVRKLVAHWMDSRTHYIDLYQAISLAGTLNLKDVPVAKYAEKLLADKTCPATYRMNALSTLARVGGVEQLTTLAKSMDDKTPYTVRWFVNGAQTVHDIEVRDVALAMSILVTKQKPESYGFEVRNPNILNDAVKFSYMYYSFPDEKTRAAAFAAWKDWQAAQKKMPPAQPPADKK